MEKRYQVFVSSTYADLKDERRRVIQALMEMDCIPAGMELFPAADEEQWAFNAKGMQHLNVLAHGFRRLARNHGRNFGKPVWRLQQSDFAFAITVEQCDGFFAVGLIVAEWKRPLDGDAGIRDFADHGRPARRASLNCFVVMGLRVRRSLSRASMARARSL